MRLLIGFGGGIRLALQSQGAGETRLGIGRFGVDLRRATKERFGLWKALLQAANSAQQRERANIVRIIRQRRPDCTLCALEISA